MTKVEVCAALVAKHGLENVLVVHTPFTGGVGFYPAMRAAIPACRRLVYAPIATAASPDCSADGAPIDWKGPSEKFADALATFGRQDLVFLDSWHTYETSARDLSLALALVNPGRFVVCHDVVALDPKLATPAHPVPFAPWQGETWRVFVDAVLANADVDYHAHADDCGVGVVRAIRRSVPDAERRLFERWVAARGSHAFYVEYHRELLRVA